MAKRTPVLLLSFLALLIFVQNPSAISSEDIDLDDDLSILQEDDDAADSFLKGSQSLVPDHPGEEDEDDDESDDFGNYDEFGGTDAEEHAMPKVDEKDVLVLKERNFTTVIENNRFVMVEFYAPWCGHCQSLAPDYAAAATELKEDNVVLAKVDATEENELAHEYDVQGFPTVLFFVDGAHKPFSGQRNKHAIVTWIRKKIGPGIYNITTIEDAEQILNSENKIVLGFLNSLVGLESNELAAASRQDDDVIFYQTVNTDVAKVFHIEPSVKRPTLVLLKKEDEKLSRFDGNFSKSEIAEFVFSNKLPLVTTFTQESASFIFDSAIKKQLLLFATLNDSKTLLPTFQEVAKFFKGKLIFVYVQIDNEDVGKPVSEFFGITGYSPTVLGYTGNDDGKKFLFDGALSADKIKGFGEDFLEEKLKPFLKSDPIPENNDGDVKVVVGNSLDEIVLDESKDVLLEIYAPWCGHCQSLEPTYNKLARHLRGIESLVIAKMDGTTNEHPRAKSDGFPTILFFPAGSKSFDPITVDADRTVVGLYKFLKKNAAIPFKLRRTTPKSDEAGGEKDEL